MSAPPQTTSATAAAPESSITSMDFYRAVRMLDAAHPDLPRTGAAFNPAQEPIRFGQKPELTFARTPIDSFAPATDTSPPRLYVNFLGLFGPNGPLPLHLTEYARGRIRHHSDPTFSAFCDIFHHRMIALFYRAWMVNQLAADLDRPAEQSFARYIGSFLGAATSADSAPPGADGTQANPNLEAAIERAGAAFDSEIARLKAALARAAAAFDAQVSKLISETGAARPGARDAAFNSRIQKLKTEIDRACAAFDTEISDLISETPRSGADLPSGISKLKTAIDRATTAFDTKIATLISASGLGALITSPSTTGTHATGDSPMSATGSLPVSGMGDSPMGLSGTGCQPVGSSSTGVPPVGSSNMGDSPMGLSNMGVPPMSATGSLPVGSSATGSLPVRSSAMGDSPMPPPPASPSPPSPFATAFASQVSKLRNEIARLGAAFDSQSAKLKSEITSRHDPVPLNAKLHYVGRLSSPVRNTEGLESIISEFFSVPAGIQTHIGRWIPMPGDCYCRLGARSTSSTLGQTAIIGTRVWDTQLSFRIHLGPMRYADYKRLLPRGDSFHRLRDWVHTYAGNELYWDVRLSLRADEVPMLRLNGACGLGWTTWLHSAQPEKPCSHLLITPKN